MKPSPDEANLTAHARPIADAALFTTTHSTTLDIDIRHIDAAFTGRRRLLDATATVKSSSVAWEAHVRSPPSLFTTTTTTRQPHQRRQPDTLAPRPQQGDPFNVRRRALSQTPASLVQPAFSASGKARLCCSQPSHAAALGAHVTYTYMERAIFITPAGRRRNFSYAAKHIWLPRTHEQRSEQ